MLSSNPPPGNRYHIRIDSLSGGLYGYVSISGVHAGLVGNNPNTTWNDVDAYATCMVLNRDYTGFPGSPQRALDATTAHEFNHSIQYGYGAVTGANAPDYNFIEGGATWMEDEVQDSANDNYNYLWPTFSMCMGEYTDSPYPYWITFRGMTERYGTGTAGGGEQVMQDFWQATSQSSTSNMLSALNTALVNKGTTLANAYHAYAIAVKFNKTCGGGYVYPYCFEEAAGYVSTAGPTSVHGTIAAAGDNYSGSIADNYALNWISLPTSGGPYTVTLQNTSSGGQLRGSVVCDTGSALNVNALPAVVGPGSSSSLTNFNPTGCTNVVAVVTNQSQTADNPTSCTARNYMLGAGSGAPPSSAIYLPIVLKGGSSSGPTPGFWESTTGDEFYVTPDRAYVDNFAIYISVLGCGTYKITHTPLEPITNNQFSFSGSFYASGTFNSPTTASGTDGLSSFYIPGCGYINGGPWSWSAIWQNSSQPRLMPAKVAGTETVEAVTAANSSHIVIPVK